MTGKSRGWGGARPGAGRKPKPPAFLGLSATYDDPEQFLRAVMNDATAEAKLRIDAAKALMPYVHPRKGEGGKKDAAQQAAKKANNRFAPATPPKLITAGGKKV
ncbi:terminase small subunit [Inhella sp.]|uniref:terminase small subunit n=1 Tax=Inhella sp. TaxID=1921806 RepID=UPI0035B2B8F8